MLVTVTIIGLLAVVSVMTVTVIAFECVTAQCLSETVLDDRQPCVLHARILPQVQFM